MDLVQSLRISEVVEMAPKQDPPAKLC